LNKEAHNYLQDKILIVAHTSNYELHPTITLVRDYINPNDAGTSARLQVLELLQQLDPQRQPGPFPSSASDLVPQVTALPQPISPKTTSHGTRSISLSSADVALSRSLETPCTPLTQVDVAGPSAQDFRAQADSSPPLPLSPQDRSQRDHNLQTHPRISKASTPIESNNDESRIFPLAELFQDNTHLLAERASGLMHDIVREYEIMARTIIYSLPRPRDTTHQYAQNR